jgi:hypothetical protein
MLALPRPLVAWLLPVLLAACATRSGDVRPAVADPAQFAAWSCDALYDEADRVRQRAAQVAYALDERTGNNIVALGLGVTVFWPALLAMRPSGPDALELAQLKGRDDAVRVAQAASSTGSSQATSGRGRASMGAILPCIGCLDPAQSSAPHDG